jgi:hypothetical protein
MSGAYVRFQVLVATSAEIVVICLQGREAGGSTSKMSVVIHQNTRCNIPEDSHLQ